MNTKTKFECGRTATAFFRSVMIAGAVMLFAIPASGEMAIEPFPEPSSNGALHYNRAMLALNSLAGEHRKTLSMPIWEALGEQSRQQINEVTSGLVRDGRMIIRAAKLGSRQQHARFGIDYADYGQGASLPHVYPMLEVGRLVTLAGVQAQIKGDWQAAADLFFCGMRLAYHMTDQPTLVETLIGIELLEHNYYALAFWASKCPEPELLDQAAARFEIARGRVRPAQTLAFEAAIVRRQLDSLSYSYPDGPWAEMLLESLGQVSAADSRAEREAEAKRLSVQWGLPSGVFEDKSSFDAFVKELGELYVGYFQAGAACMALPPLDRVKRAKELGDSYRSRFQAIGDRDVLDVQQIAVFFATHEAQETMVRVALAVAAARTDSGFPSSLTQFASRFQGRVPSSPYDGSPVTYRSSKDGSGFTIIISAVNVAGTELPGIEFSSSSGGEPDLPAGTPRARQ